MIYYISMFQLQEAGKIRRKKFSKIQYIKKINPKKNLVIGFGITDKTISL